MVFVQCAKVILSGGYPVVKVIWLDMGPVDIELQNTCLFSPISNEKHTENARKYRAKTLNKRKKKKNFFWKKGETMAS